MQQTRKERETHPGTRNIQARPTPWAPTNMLQIITTKGPVRRNPKKKMKLAVAPLTAEAGGPSLKPVWPVLKEKVRLDTTPPPQKKLLALHLLRLGIANFTNWIPIPPLGNCDLTGGNCQTQRGVGLTFKQAWSHALAFEMSHISTHRDRTLVEERL